MIKKFIFVGFLCEKSISFFSSPRLYCFDIFTYMIPKRLAVSYLLLILFSVVHADLFTSTADLQRLLDEEKEIPNLIESFIVFANTRLEQLKNFIQQYKNSLGSQKNANISNPINAYRMIRRLVNTRREFESLLENDPMQNIHDIIRHFYPPDVIHILS
jgi:hypothetical protein